jgi:hypothetical protein
MVGFVSLSGYSSEAKNAKVTSDITTIQRWIETKVAQWWSLMAFVSENKKNRLTNLSIAWKKATEENYVVWTLNYTALWIRKDEFLDPNGNEYVIWATTTWGWRMEIAWVIEIDWKKQTILRWSYSWRGTEKQNINTVSWKMIVLEYSGTNFFRNWDYVKIWPVKYNIKSVKRDWITIVLDKEVVWKFTKVSLVEAEWKSLISDYRDNIKYVENGSTEVLPY